MTETNALFRRSATVDTLAKILRDCPEGETVSWTEMERLTNRDIRGKDRHLVESARKIVFRETGAVFGGVVRVGLQRMEPREHLMEGRRRGRLIGRAAARAGSIVRAADMKRLTPDERLTQASMAGAFAMIQEAAQATVPPAPSGGNHDPNASSDVFKGERH